MNKVFELSYEQTVNRGLRSERVSFAVAGYTQSASEAEAFKQADSRNQVQIIEMSDDEMWQVE